MSRVANMPVHLPSGVTATISAGNIVVKGPKGTLQKKVNNAVDIASKDNTLTFSMRIQSKRGVDALAGTMRAVVSKMVIGVTEGFSKKLELVGVGYRAQTQGNKLNLTLGFSHPVVFDIPAGISIETPSQTEVIVNGMDCELLGQVAAKIRAYRPPEPYKGKGVKYSNERIVMKETKKK
ncbi:MAG: 50S ribosomal protein L6 [Gammaproteobacteria bacterium]|nr:50S ribosomal protein L6 [Gammaproteobacteria bacterium]